MALLGMKKKQAFGQVPMMGATPEPMAMGAPVQGMGQMADITDMPAMAQQPMQDNAPAKFKPNLLGVIGDAMQVFGGGQATYMNGVREQQQRAELMRERAMQAQQERETGWQDYVRKQEYERANPAAPDVPSNVRTAMWYQNATDEQKAAFREANPIVSYMADGTPRIVDPSMMGKPSGPQIGAVEDGYQFVGGDPKNPASWKQIGGSVAQQPNTFRP